MTLNAVFPSRLLHLTSSHLASLHVKNKGQHERQLRHPPCTLPFGNTACLQLCFLILENFSFLVSHGSCNVQYRLSSLSGRNLVSPYFFFFLFLNHNYWSSFTSVCVFSAIISLKLLKLLVKPHNSTLPQSLIKCHTHFDFSLLLSKAKVLCI